jgi:PAS domain S-box-containing protein
MSSGERLAALESENARLRGALAQARGEQAADGLSFHAIADSIDQMIWTTRPDGFHDWFNRRWYEFTGMPEGSTDGEEWNGMFHPDDQERAWAAWRHSLATGEPYEIEYRLRHRSGAYRWVLGRARPVRDGIGQIVRWYGTCTDINAARSTRDALKESEGRFRNMADHAPVMMWVTDPSGACTYLNRAWYDFTGQTEAEALGLGWLEATHPDDKPLAEEAFLRANAHQAPFRVEYRLRRADGAYRWAIDAASPRLGPDGDFLGYVGSVIDIGDRREAEESLRSSEARLRLAADATDIGVFDWDLRTNELRWDDRVRAMFGLRRGAPADYQTFSRGLHPDDLAATDAAVQAALRPDGPGTFDVEYRTIGLEDGIERWIAARGQAVFEDGQAVRFIGTTVDITERKSAETALARSEAALREESRVLETLNQTGAAIAAELDLERLVQMVTDAGVALTGAQFGAFFYNVLKDDGERFMLYTLSGAERAHFEQFGMPRPTAVFHPTFAGEGTIRSDDILLDPRYGQNDPHSGMPKGHLPVRSYMAVSVIGRSGEVIGALLFGHPEPGRFTERHERLITGVAGQAAVGIDNARLYQAAQKELTERMRAEEGLRELNDTLELRVTDEVDRRNQAEEALRQAQKMETLGQLTGGVAHDFNNLLQIVTGNIEIIQRNLGDEQGRLRRAADNAMRGAERAAILTQRLLAFARRQPLEPKPTSLNRMVAGMSELLHRTLGETVEVETVLASGLWSVEADPNQLENALLNLAINARDAMPDGGKLTIETANTHLDRDYSQRNTGVIAGQYVAVCVSDTGTGMDPATLDRVFEPFFTTKDIGRGTGLGLSMVYGFVKQSGGHVKIYSEPGEGTTVKIYLPRLRAEVTDESETEKPNIPEGSREETVLVCEDDDDVRAYSVEVLRELGYRVLEAHDGPSALRLLERQEGIVDLLFTDVVLPSGMMGNHLAEQARAIRPDLKVLFTTGYARNAIVHHGRLDPGVELITKPFSYADLAARIRDLLDGT